jgi:peptidoglycan hydrolase-like protein with peptidoglycan-binding domain
MKLGDSGNDILDLQNMLVKFGYLTATPNGYFGQATKKAVINWQRDNGLSMSGMVGSLSRQILNK